VSKLFGYSVRAGNLAIETAAVVVMLGLVARPAHGQGSPADVTFAKSVQPFFAKNCYACHNPKLNTGGMNLEVYTSAALLSRDQDE